MGVNSVSDAQFQRALIYASDAQKVLKMDLTADQRGQLVARWGAENVKAWTSVDGNDYVIDDVSYDSAKQAGQDAAAERVGYDGGKSYSALVDVVGSAATVASTALMSTIGGKVLSKITQKAVEKAAEKAGEKLSLEASKKLAEKTSQKMGARVAACFAAAEATRYLAAKPNKEQYDKLMQIQQSELPQGVEALNQAQSDLADATETVIALSEEAEEMSEETNEEIEGRKALFDFYRTQYDTLKTKALSGESLTQQEKDVLKELAPTMEAIGEDIVTLGDDATEGVEDLYSQIGDAQEMYDDSAASIAEIEGMTEYVEGFDEATRTMAYVEMAAQGLNAASAGTATGILMATNIFGWNTPFIALGLYATGVSGNAVFEQKNMASAISEEIHLRRDVQSLGEETTGIYLEELDNYAGAQEVVEDLELEMPEDLEVPPDAETFANSQQAGGANSITMAAANQQNGENGNNPQSPLTAGNSQNNQQGVNPMNSQNANRAGQPPKLNAVNGNKPNQNNPANPHSQTVDASPNVLKADASANTNTKSVDSKPSNKGAKVESTDASGKKKKSKEDVK